MLSNLRVLCKSLTHSMFAPSVKVVSIAYIKNLKKSLESTMSLIYIINRSDPKIDPWGTPVVIDASSN